MLSTWITVPYGKILAVMIINFKKPYDAIRSVVSRLLENFEKHRSTIFWFFGGFSRKVDPRTYIDQFFSIWAFRLLNMSQIRWLRPCFMNFPIPNMWDETIVLRDKCSESILFFSVMMIVRYWEFPLFSVLMITRLPEILPLQAYFLERYHMEFLWWSECTQ